MKLLIDMGNSRLKWAMSIEGKLQSSHALANTQLTESALRAAWAELKPNSVWLACVGNSALLELVQRVAMQLWRIDIALIQSSSQAFGVQNGYEQPEKLGVDRWLAMLAAKQHYQGALCIIDCGTAITIDVLDERGVHQGGLISAGLGLMHSALNSGTDKLPAITANTQAFEFSLARNTQAAIAHGTTAAALGLIDYVARQLPVTTTFLLTGGDAPRLYSQLKLAVIIDSDLVLRGLALFAQETRT
jgi:type III pantothenate kinase